MIRRFRSFLGGIHPDYRKDVSAKTSIEAPVLPDRVIVPLLQHIGVPCEPAVAVGDTVRTGQVIGRGSGPISAPVHATLSGTVTAIGRFAHPSGQEVRSVVIESDGADTWVDLEPADPDALSPDQLIERIAQAGIVGLGGAAFPTPVKLRRRPEQPVRTLIVNGAECEPYLTADHRLMVEDAARVASGTRIMARILGVDEVFLGIEDNKPDAVEAMEKALAAETGPPVTVGVVPTKYPQGGEKQLISVLTGREVPSGGLPVDVGVVVHNVGTAAAVDDAVRLGRPLVDRVVTVTGEGTARPGNARVRLGTPARALIEHFGGTVGEVDKVVFGGPMMGVAQWDLDVPVVKGTSGILVIPKGQVPEGAIRPCIRCSACIEVCPVGLLPNMLSVCAEQRAFPEAEEYHPFDCIECGCCSYVCPSFRPLVQMIRFAKTEVRALKQKAHH